MTTRIWSTPAGPADLSGDDPLITPSLAAAMLGVDVKTLTRYVRQGLIDCQYTAGLHRRYRVSAVKGLIAASRQRAELRAESGEGGE